MLAAARHVRALVLIVGALMAAGGASVALPVAHLFADHHHELVFPIAGGTWLWAAPDDDHGGAALEVEHHGHSGHELAVAATPLRFGKVAGRSLALTPIEILDSDRVRQAARMHGSPDPAPDIGKPDLALLAAMRV